MASLEGKPECLEDLLPPHPPDEADFYPVPCWQISKKEPGNVKLRDG